MVAAATALVLVGCPILLFLNPIYVGFEQGRTGVPALTGYTDTQVSDVTSRILGDLVLWQGGFDETVDGRRVLNDAEIRHMLDVRGVFAGLYALVLAAALLLLVAFRRAKPGTEARAETWRAVERGGRALAVVIFVAGAFVLLAFDAAFEVFHRLFFSAGSYTFDPRTDKLVQLFPEAFWSDTAMFVGIAILVACVATIWYAHARGRQA